MLRKSALYRFVVLVVVLSVLSACDSPWRDEDAIGCDTQELIQAIHDANSDPDPDTIVLDEACNYLLTEVDNHKDMDPQIATGGANGLPVIKTPITIEGNDAKILRGSTIPGTPEFRIFFISYNGVLTLNDLSVENGKVLSGNGNHNGGGILVFYGTLELNRSHVMRNESGGSGGGIYVIEGEVTSDNTSISSNTAREGGAIANTAGTVSLENYSVLGSNTASENGGAILNRGSLTVTGSRFDDNLAEIDGGAIYHAANQLNLDDVLFQENQASNNGGAIVIYYGKQFVISDCTFSGNHSDVSGGALKSNGVGTIDAGTRFQNNTSGATGGAITNGQGGELLIVDNLISGNQADGVGGGIDNLALLTIQNSEITGNTASLGGGVYSNHNLSVLNTLVSTNSATFPEPGHGFGGGLYVSGQLDLIQSTIAGNQASQDGGGLHYYSDIHEASINQTTFDANLAGGFGGGLISYGPTKVINSTFSGNQAELGGAGLYFGNTQASIVHSTIAYNEVNNPSAPVVGGLGGLSVAGNATVNIKNAIIAYNPPQDCMTAGTLSSLGENLDTDGTCLAFTITADPLLGPLAENGGPTRTHALLVGSPAVDAARDCTDMDLSLVSEDQRSVGRPQGAECDLGAYEAPATLPQPPRYSCVRIRGISMLDGGKMRIQIETPGLPEGTYNATVNNDAFACRTYPEYPDRLFCDGPKGEANTLAALTVFDPEGKQFCSLKIDIPPDEEKKPKEPPPEYQGCWWSPVGAPTVCKVPCPNDQYSGAGCNP
jgi:predicted outer membrane repeat protein